MSKTGILQQAILRDADMAQTIREKQVETQYDPVTGTEIATITTLYMQDGSRHEKRVNAEPYFPDRYPTIVETYYDKNNNRIVETSSTKYREFASGGMAGADVTTVKYPGDEVVTTIGYPDGRVSVTVHKPGHPPADVPLDLLNHPILSTASAGFSGLETQAGRGVPMLTAEASEYIRAGSKYAGPGISIAAAAWDFAVAETGFERCVAAVEGTTSVSAGVLVGLAASPGTPAASFALALAASGGGQALGNWLGNTFCPR
ncbi:hypothetical protein [Mycolicibacterium thermoresistibile]